MSDRIQDIVDRVRSFMESDVYGLFKVAVIVQQLYLRYVTGRTTDPRFAHLIEGVRVLNRVACRPSKKGRIDDLF